MKLAVLPVDPVSPTSVSVPECSTARRFRPRGVRFAGRASSSAAFEFKSLVERARFREDRRSDSRAGVGAIIGRWRTINAAFTVISAADIQV